MWLEDGIGLGSFATAPWIVDAYPISRLMMAIRHQDRINLTRAGSHRGLSSSKPYRPSTWDRSKFRFGRRREVGLLGLTLRLREVGPHSGSVHCHCISHIEQLWTEGGEILDPGVTEMMQALEIDD